MKAAERMREIASNSLRARPGAVLAKAEEAAS